MRPVPLDLSPASWIWFPSERTLANSFILFRRVVNVEEELVKATGWISADSRYRLTVNGHYIQMGPAPCDPRFLEADPADITAALRVGDNVLGVEVLYYGHGDGTWAMGKPGFLCRFEFEYADGFTEQIISDSNWQTLVDRAHRPGQYKRWFLRALQENFDARLHPYEWDTPAFTASTSWIPAMELDARADKPPISGHYDMGEYGASGTVAPSKCELRARSIPLLREDGFVSARLEDAGYVIWKRDPLDWFEFRTPNSFEITRNPSIAKHESDGYTVTLLPDGAVYLTFELKEQIVGWVDFTIEAPEGTVIELMTQEAHDPANTAWLDTHKYCWSRFICRAGLNHFETFDFESLRWLQLHIRGSEGEVKVSRVGVRRRMFAWTVEPHLETDDPVLQQLINAGINTIYNSAQDTIVDGMGRERQQYSGDIGHALHASRYLFGEHRQTARFLWTFSQGNTREGYFLDCWPAYDRLWRAAQRLIDTTDYIPCLDHSVGFGFDCWHHYLETGDLEAIREPYPRLLRFVGYLERICQSDGLLPVEDLGTVAVWIDHEAYQQQRHKQCAFNLYAAAMLKHALAPLAHAFGDIEWSNRLQAFGASIEQAVVAAFWSDEHKLFINNLPWLAEDGHSRLCDRSLATAVLYNQAPRGDIDTMLRVLHDCPPEMGFSYPANAGWRCHALASRGMVESVLDEFRTRWATMKSVVLNNTLQEFWNAKPDDSHQWCHFPISPLNVLMMDIAGIRPKTPGFRECTIHPRLGSLGQLDLTVHTMLGAIRFSSRRTSEGHDVRCALPPGCTAELISEPGVTIHLL